MKKLILLLAVVLPMMAFGQIEVGTVFQNKMTVIYQNVDRAAVSTGLLKDYGLMMTDVEVFNGTLQSNNYVNRSVWSTLYTSVYNMRFNANATLAAVNTVNTAIDNYIATDGATINLMALNYQYQQFNRRAVLRNLVYVFDDQIYDTPGRTSSPYDARDAFAFAPSNSNLSGGTQTFLLRSDLFYTNVTKSISSRQVDFNDGLGFRAITLGVPISANYTTAGAKDLVFKVAYTDGQILQSQARINVTGIILGCNNCRYDQPSTKYFPDPLINFPVPASQMGFSFATIATAGNDGILDKPLILVEGFDPENSFNFLSYRDGNVALAVPVNINFPGQTLAQALEANNYDLVFLNYGNGGDDIKRNAYLLENIIQWVNQQTAAAGSTQKNVVIGVSMGGIVARYALRDMELRNVNHNTRLYASIDSPHQGANVPLGFQAAVKFLGGLNFFGISLTGSNPQLARALNGVNSPAATQMLTYQLSGQGSSIAFNNTSYNNFYNEYKTMGMPRLWGIRNIAVANGSECAQTQYTPYSLMLTGNGTQNINYLINLLTGPLQTLTIDPFALFTGLITTKSDVKIDMAIRSLPNQQSLPIMNFRLYYRKEILFGLITSTSDLINFTYNSPASLLPLDSNPGGAFDINNFASIPTSISIIGLTTPLTRFSFIPTTSSLDIGGGTQPIVAADYLRAYSTAAPPAAPKNVPFNNFFSNPLSNEIHPQLTTRNGNWLFLELQGTPQVFSCNYLCANTDVAPSILGPDPLCTSGTFTLANATPSAPVAWTSSNTSALTIDAATGQATKVGGFSGLVTVFSTINGGCGNSAPLSKTVSVGLPNPYNNAIVYVSNKYGVNPVTLGGGGAYEFYMDAVQGATSYDWNLPLPRTSGFSFLGGSPTTNAAVIQTGTIPGTYQIVCAPQNVCGSAGARFLSVVIQNGGGGGIQLRSAYPNPANDKLVVKIKEVDSDDEAEITLIDKNLQKVFEIRSKEKEVSIPVAGLAEGIYYLHIVIAGKKEERQIVIKH